MRIKTAEHKIHVVEDWYAEFRGQQQPIAPTLPESDL